MRCEEQGANVPLLDLLFNAVRRRHIRFVARLFQLHFQTLGSNLETVHRLNGGIRRPLIIIAHKACKTIPTLRNLQAQFKKRTKALA